MADERVPGAAVRTRMTDAEALMWNVEKDPWLNPNGGVCWCATVRSTPPTSTGGSRSGVRGAPPPRTCRVHFGRWSPPVWRPDPEFDLAFHVRRIGLGAPGTTRDLLDLVVQLYQDPFDRSRPLWQFFIIDGLEGGRHALFWKIHHAITDGIGMGYLAEYHIQRTVDADPARVDLDAVVAAAVDADEAASERPPVATALAATAGHVLRRQAGISRRMMGEMAMWGADPHRVVDLVNGVTKTVRQTRGQLFTGGGSEATGSPLWRSGPGSDTSRCSTSPSSRRRRQPSASAAASTTSSSPAPSTEWSPTTNWPAHRSTSSTSASSSAPGRTRRSAGTRSPRPGCKSAAEDVAGGTLRRGPRPDGGQAGRGDRARDAVDARRDRQPATDVARDPCRPRPSATTGLRHQQRPRVAHRALRLRRPRLGPYAFGPVAGTAFNLTTVSYNGQLGCGLFVDPAAVTDPAQLRDDMIAAYQQLIGNRPRQPSHRASVSENGRSVAAAGRKRHGRVHAAKRDPKLIRAWAIDNGIAVAACGRIPAEAERQYHEASGRS